MVFNSEINKSGCVLNETKPDFFARGGLLTVLETASYLRLSRSMIYNLMDSGKLRYVKIGSARRVPKDSCAEFIESHLTGGWNLRVGNETLRSK